MPDTRAEFEHIFSGEPHNFTMERYADEGTPWTGEYRHRDTLYAWLGWQAARSATGTQAELRALRAETKIMRHRVITCGVAASHPDPDLTRTGAYANKWDSEQAERVRALRADRDRLAAELAGRHALHCVAIYPGLAPQQIARRLAWWQDTGAGMSGLAIGYEHDGSLSVTFKIAPQRTDE